MLEVKHFRINIIFKSIEVSKPLKTYQRGFFIIFMKSKNMHHFKARPWPFILMTANKRGLLRCFLDTPHYLQGRG